MFQLNAYSKLSAPNPPYVFRISFGNLFLFGPVTFFVESVCSFLLPRVVPSYVSPFSNNESYFVWHPPYFVKTFLRVYAPVAEPSYTNRLR